MAATDTSGTSRVAWDVSFVGTRFTRARGLGPLRAAGCVHLDGTVWHERALVDLSARRVSCRHSRFLSGVHLRVRCDPDDDEPGTPEVALDDAVLAHPSVVTDAPPFPSWTAEVRRRGRRHRPGRATRPVPG